MAWSIRNRIVFWTGFGLLIIILSGMAILFSVEMISTDDELIANYANDGLDLQVEYIFFRGHNRRFIGIGSAAMDDNRPLICYVHGAPGGCTAFNAFLKDTSLISRFDMISVDRPGYGPQDAGLPVVDIAVQAEYLAKVVLAQLRPGQQVYFVSHSFGGPIAALAALSLDSLAGGHLMLSPVISAHDEKIFWYADLPLRQPFSWIASSGMQVAAAEKLMHQVEVAKFRMIWKEIESPTLHIHGQRDLLAPVTNVNFGKKHFDAECYDYLIWANAGHLIPWTMRQQITNEMIEFIDQASCAGNNSK